MKKSIDGAKTQGPRIYPSGAMISQTSGHGDSRLPSEKSRRFGGTTSRGELLEANFIADPGKNVLVIMKDGKIYKNAT